MNRLLAMFVLTPREQRLVIFVVIALVAGVWIKHERDKEANDRTGRGKAGLSLPSVSPTPNEREAIVTLDPECGRIR